MTKFLWRFSVCICAVAAAGAVQTAHAAVIPSAEPTAAPTAEPSAEPTAAPTAEPSAEPTAAPTAEPSAEPTAASTAEPSVEPTAASTAEPSAEPTAAPSVESFPDEKILASLQDILEIMEVQPYAYYDTYYGSISSTYLEYMRGYLSKLPPDAHYVGARTGQYDYVFAYGADLTYNGSSFSGAVTVIRWSTYNNGSMYQTYDSAFRLNPGSYLVYSDLSDKYPSLATSSDMTLRQILILFTIFCLCLTIDHMYQVRRIRRVRKEKR